MNRIMKLLLTFGTVYMSICLMIFPKEGSLAAQNTIILCLQTVVPSLLPYIICSGYLAASGFATIFSRYLSPIMKPLFGVPGSAAIAFVLGTVSGYPIGAVAAADLYASGECSRGEAEKMLAFCNNSGPVFIMSVVGAGFLQSPHLGRLLYISHVMSAVLVGIIMRTYRPKVNILQNALPPVCSKDVRSTFRIFGSVMDSSVHSILKICGFVIFFSIFSASLPKTALSPYIHAFLEITGGIKQIAVLNIDFDLKMSIISFFLAFSGMSVLFQVGAIAASKGLSLKPYFMGKIIQGILSALLTKILVSRIPQTVDVFLQNSNEVMMPSAPSCLFAALIMLGFGMLVLFLLLGMARLRR